MPAIGPQISAHLLKRTTTPPADDEPEVSNVYIAGPQLPPHLLNNSAPPAEDDDDDDDDYAPALPPDLLHSRSAPTTAQQKRVLGPSFPGPYRHDRQNDESEDDDYGPMPMPAGSVRDELDGVQEFIEREERRRKEIEKASKPKALKRDEWMLVPPSSSDLLGSLDPTKLRARQFSRSAAPSKTVDNSLWTETPQERLQRIQDEVSGKKKRAANAEDDGGTNSVDVDAEARKRRRMDEKIRQGVEEHNKSTRNASLVEMHAKGTSSNAKEVDETQNAIWDHSRDMSIGGNLMDEKSRSKLIRDAKGLGDRFGTGKHGGYL